MKIKFLNDYLGRETAMKQYKAGDIDDLDFAQAQELIRLGIVTEDMTETVKRETVRWTKKVKHGTDT